MQEKKPEWLSFKEVELNDEWLENHKKCTLVKVKHSTFKSSTKIDTERVLCYYCKERAIKVLSENKVSIKSRTINKSHFVKDKGKSKSFKFATYG